MGYDIVELFAREKRDPASIKTWLLNHKFSSDTIDIVLSEYAQRIANGEVFGYTDAGISILSNMIRSRVRELSLNEDLCKKLGKFHEQIPLYKRIWKFLSKPLWQ